MKNQAPQALALVLALAAAGHAAAADRTTVVNSGDARAAASSDATWTDADYARAKPVAPKVNVLPPQVFDYNAAVANASQVEADVKGSKGGADAAHLFQQRQYATKKHDGGVGGDAVGTGGLQFTSTRVFPNDADTTYPTRAVGKLFFKDSAGNSYWCTGSMVKPGIVVTAGHCVNDGSGHYFTAWQFVPGYRKVGATETRPYGTWANWAMAQTTSDWLGSGGVVPNLRDWAIIVFNKDASGKRIGDYTGWLGYQYPSLIGKQQSVLGYPANLDLGTQSHLIASLATSYGSLNNGTWGSDMEGGSSGGPVVLNFRKDYTNTSSDASDNAGNRVTSVTSWGYISTAPKVQGGSQFDSVFGTMITNACTNYAFAC